MKHIISCSLCLTAITACNSFSAKDETIDFIPGTYVAYYENEFHKTHDTLLIQQNVAGKTMYNIIHAYYYTTTVDGKALTPSYKKEKWIGIYDEKNNILVEQRHGSIISFDPEKKILKRGNREYKKI